MASILGMDGRRAFVVGGGLGMGRETALLLARAGCRVALVDSEADRAEAVAAEIRSDGGEAHAFAADVTDDAQAEGAVRGAVAALGGLDTLVNIVGGAVWGSLLEQGPEHWDQQMNLNLRQHWGRVSRERPGHGGGRDHGGGGLGQRTLRRARPRRLRRREGGIDGAGPDHVGGVVGGAGSA